MGVVYQDLVEIKKIWKGNKVNLDINVNSVGFVMVSQTTQIGAKCLTLARDILQGAYGIDITEGATHYHSDICKSILSIRFIK